MTGASGFVGQAVVAALRASGQDVVAVARHAGDGFRGVRDYAELAPDNAEDALIHLAETNDIAAAEAAGEAHVEACRRLFTALLSKGWSHVVYASSAAVYGDGVHRPRQPDEAVAPGGSYGRAKVACEELAVCAGGAVARLGNVYGPGMSGSNVLGGILRQIPGDGPILVRDTSPVRDFLWIADAGTGLAVMATGRARGIYNLGSGQGTSVGELARAALAAAGEKHRAVVATMPGDRQSHLVLDASMTVGLGWHPEASLAEGLAQMVQQ